MATNNNWKQILDLSREIIDSYDTPVTLRQLFYQLVAKQVFANTRSNYSQLSDKTAQARREGNFPDFEDMTRRIHKQATFESVEDARQWLASIYRRDRTEGQEYNLYIGVEKNGLRTQLQNWFGKYGIPILALGGYSSQTYADIVTRAIVEDPRPAVLLYAGDFDPSGEDILRDFLNRVPYFEKVHHVGLTYQQVQEYNLPENFAKETDTRCKGFADKYGTAIQVELDALNPKMLRKLYQEKLSMYLNLSVYEKVLEIEEQDRRELINV